MNNFHIGDEFYIDHKILGLTKNKRYMVTNVEEDKVYFINDMNCLDWVNYTHATKVDNTTKNNGGETDYYKIKEEWTTAQDIIEAREMNFAQGNIFKVAFTFNIGRHEATDYLRELNKMEYFIKREKERLSSLLKESK